MKRFTYLAVFTAVLVLAGVGHAQVAAKKALTLDGAKQVIAASVAEARRNHAGGAIAVVDDGQVVGGIGVSGAASAAQDEEIAMVGANAAKAFTSAAATTMPAEVTHLDGARVTAAFAKGMPLLEVEGYKIHASRRDGPGMAEVHDIETDVVYVLDGAATLVTGGTVVDGKRTEPDQIRGAAIQGGQSRRIAKGDVVVIPNGVPHLFKDVQAPLLYFVVKPIAMTGGGK